MDVLIEVSYDAADAEKLYTLLEQRYPEVHAGGQADGFTVKGAWVALASGAAYFLLEVKVPWKVYELCEKMACADMPSVKVRAVPLLGCSELKKVEG
jgi:hypothetical protein